MGQTAKASGFAKRSSRMGEWSRDRRVMFWFCGGLLLLLLGVVIGLQQVAVPFA